VGRDNYSYIKYQRELAQKKKKEEKRQSKLDKKNKEAQSAVQSDTEPVSQEGNPVV
jgi:hypothetical protein